MLFCKSFKNSFSIIFSKKGIYTFICITLKKLVSELTFRIMNGYKDFYMYKNHVHNVHVCTCDFDIHVYYVHNFLICAQKKKFICAHLIFIRFDLKKRQSCLFYWVCFRLIYFLMP